MRRRGAADALSNTVSACLAGSRPARLCSPSAAVLPCRPYPASPHSSHPTGTATLRPAPPASTCPSSGPTPSWSCCREPSWRNACRQTGAPPHCFLLARQAGRVLGVLLPPTLRTGPTYTRSTALQLQAGGAGGLRGAHRPAGGAVPGSPAPRRAHPAQLPHRRLAGGLSGVRRRRVARWAAWGLQLVGGGPGLAGGCWGHAAWLCYRSACARSTKSWAGSPGEAFPASSQLPATPPS